MNADLKARLKAEATRRDVSEAQLVAWALERQLPEWEAQDLDATVVNPAIRRG